MIDIRELRIGNTVKGGDYTLNPSTITKIDAQSAIAKSNSGNDFTSIHGLPLFEVHLSDYGFTNGYKINNITLLGKSFNGVDIGLKEVGNGQYEVFIMNETKDTHIAIRRISYLHELQNLIFILFGVEL